MMVHFLLSESEIKYQGDEVARCPLSRSERVYKEDELIGGWSNNFSSPSNLRAEMQVFSQALSILATVLLLAQLSVHALAIPIDTRIEATSDLKVI